ncbi:hypothetical protein RI367_000268 [Sorochytrium milnesiophthora]
MLSNLFARSVVVGCGLLWPAYRSFKLFRRRATAASAAATAAAAATAGNAHNASDLAVACMWDDVVKHYSVMAVFTVVEWPADMLLFWLPFYDEVKLAFVLWLCLPQTKGSVLLYEQCLEPFLVQHERRVDETILELQNELIRRGGLYGSGLIKTCKATLVDLFMRLLATVTGTAHLHGAHVNQQQEQQQQQNALTMMAAMGMAAAAARNDDNRTTSDLSTRSTTPLWQRIVHSIEPATSVLLSGGWTTDEQDSNDGDDSSTLTTSALADQHHEPVVRRVRSDSRVGQRRQPMTSPALAPSPPPESDAMAGAFSSVVPPARRASTVTLRSKSTRPKMPLTMSAATFAHVADQQQQPKAKTASTLYPTLPNPLPVLKPIPSPTRAAFPPSPTKSTTGSNPIPGHSSPLPSSMSTELQNLAAESVNYDDYDLVHFHEYSEMKSDVGSDAADDA